jgi:HNH endonuclease
MLPTTQDKARFWSRIVKDPSGCWLFTGSLQQGGYGRTTIDGKQITTHRFSWIIANGPIPPGLVVCHKCNTPPCCNPAHLFLGTTLQNNRHCISQGRAFIKLPDRQWRRLFHPIQQRGRTPEQRFWNFVDKQPGGCWLWKGAKLPTGYGNFAVNRTRVYAHRFSWELHRGPIPKGVWLLHNCPGGDNPSCCNPEHLRLGTPKENAIDAVNKGRMQPQAETFKRFWREKGHLYRGENNQNSKLTTAQVLEMRRLHAEEGWGYKRLRKHFGISFGVAQRIINRLSWKSV